MTTANSNAASIVSPAWWPMARWAARAREALPGRVGLAERRIDPPQPELGIADGPQLKIVEPCGRGDLVQVGLRHRPRFGVAPNVEQPEDQRAPPRIAAGRRCGRGTRGLAGQRVRDPGSDRGIACGALG